MSRAQTCYAKCSCNVGEISPLAQGRSDQDFMQRATSLMQGFAAQVQGGAIKQSGTLYLGDKESIGAVLLQPFAFNLDYIYLLEIGERYIRFWRDDALLVGSSAGNIITDGGFDNGLTGWNGFQVGGAAAVTAENGKALLKGSNYQSGSAGGIYKDVTVTPGAAYTLRLNRTDNALSHVADDRNRLYAGLVPRWSSGPSLPLTFVGGKTSPGVINVPAGSDTNQRLVLFLDSQYGSNCYVDDIWLEKNEAPVKLVTPYAAADLAQLRLHSIADEIYISHPLYKTRTISRTGVNAFSIAEFEPDYPPFRCENTSAVTLTPSATTGNITLTASAALFTANHVGMQYEIRKTSTVNGVAKDLVGRLKITSITSPTQVAATVMPGPGDETALPAAEATARWSESAWNLMYGFPSVVASAHNRLIFGGTLFDPGAYWLSETDNFKSFATGSLATSAIARTLPDDQLSAMCWMRAYGAGVVIGTLTAEYLIHSGQNEAAWTVDTVRASKVSNYGSAPNVAAIGADSDVLYVQAGGEMFKRFAEEMSDTEALYFSTLSVYAEHLTRNDPIVATAWAGPPYQTALMVTRSGAALGMTYLKEHKVFAWWRCPLGGVAVGVAALPGRDGYNVYWAVRRTIGGQQRVCIEKQVRWFDSGVLADGHFLLCGRRSTGSNLTTLTGLDHFEGETVAVVADGIYQGTALVSAGAVTVSAPASVIAAGLELDSRLNLLPIDYIDAYGRYQGDMTNINKVTVFVVDTGEGLLVSGTGKDGDWVRFPELERGKLYTGKTSANLFTVSADGSLFFKSVGPNPVNIIKVIYHFGG